MRPRPRRGAALLLTGGMVVAGAAPAQAAAPAGLRVTGMETEHATAPIAVAAANPRLGWRLRSDRRGERQTAYRISVAAEAGGGQVWDSGTVKSARAYDVRYGGPALRPATRYTWRVRVADARGHWTGWSAKAAFETALAGDGWRGSWIGAPDAAASAPDLKGSSWIWFPEGDPATSAPAATRYFRGAVDLASVPQGARLVMTADDGFTAWVNGTEVGGREPDPSKENWKRPIVVDVAAALRQGRNVIAVKATNGRQSPAGLLGRLELPGQAPKAFDTGDAWRALDTAPAAEWTVPGFDDASWKAAKVLVPWGGAPWGEVSVEAPSRPEPLLRRDFTVPGKKVARARLYAAAGGYAELSLNGEKVGDEVLAPGFTRYDKRVEYVTHDVTRMLRRGGNAIGARLGRGFYGMTQENVWNWHKTPWTAEPRLLAQLVVTYTDGSAQTIATDGQWRYAEGPVRYDSLFGGETYDAREEKPGWDRAGYDAASWGPATKLAAPAGTVVPEEHEPIKVTGTIRPSSVTSPKKGTHVFKLPANIAGWARIRTHGPKGAQVTLKYGERLNADGTVQVSNGNVTGRVQTDEYVLAGRAGTETWESRYTYKGFQYVEVTGWPGDAAPTTADLDGRAVHTDLRPTGSFRSSNALFNQVNTMTRQTVVNNWHGIPTDTPMYEKNGWTGDAQLMADMEMTEYDLRRPFTKWMTDHRDSQGADGLIPGIVPDNGWGLGYYGQAPPWHASFTAIPWQMYQRYGDKDVLAANYPAMTRYLDGWLAKADGEGLYPSSLTDYLAPGYGGNTPEDARLAGTAYTYFNTTTVADVAQALGRTADAARYRAAAAKTRDAFNKAFLRGDAYVTASDPGYRQTSALLPLAFGITPEASEKAVTARLVKDVEDRGGHLNTGALGTKFLLTELTERGQGELAYKIADQKTYPSWGYWAANGATTLWERWDLDARSRDHVFLGGAIGEWFYRDLAGIRSAAPGYDRVRIAPKPLGDLTFVEASTETPHGPVAVRWDRRAGGGLGLRVRVPVGATAEIEIPAASAAAVTEGGRPLASVPGVRVLGAAGGTVRVETGSGGYDFQARK
ncbi:family 78 glycoside hydrolase catalytic domain [Actinomadura xylanilytica]|uniref:family 78 glycoside hydrolase catalytic domain n=1 Tax=Actinomadura xylanilytica TaxID=887459 RepID=UPI00255AC6B5|nr:family 78 glycoside hydrolase catalytic domain [Actinomadura xylanilytica]MDL4774423.1 family 78 glycoside hydrolase catalytic domain [Actinomadura xylanilytica]